ncbi:Hypothetical protein, putative [Bodo saltans]|uniref:Membrane-associated protein n=1 Tax=Bodo saltans TaxID=75058 RepID=A0A0S4KKM5_BODSA|nr:Hypothetical protein, putative [Bodo saltans]|eukprot:CUI14942.1 Hypothetical protein, putative [Bodo saltans]
MMELTSLVMIFSLTSSSLGDTINLAMYYTTIHETSDALRSPPRPRAVYAAFNIQPSSTPVLAGPLRGAVTASSLQGGAIRSHSPLRRQKREVYNAPPIAAPAQQYHYALQPHAAPYPSHVHQPLPYTPTAIPTPSPQVIVLAPPQAATPVVATDWELQRKVVSVEAKLDQLLQQSQRYPSPPQHHSNATTYHSYEAPSSFVYGPSVPAPHVNVHHTYLHQQPYVAPYIDPSAVARDLYGPLPTLSPHRAHHATLPAGPYRRPLGAIDVPPPPVLPTYFPARDHMDAVEDSYAWLVLRNLMRDVEDAEIRDRLRIMEEQVISAGRLEEQRVELRALLKESLAEERLAALDAEAMLRRHYATVAMGETHRALVDSDLNRSHQQREASPDGRHGREMLERSHHPSPVRVVRTLTTTTTQQRPSVTSMTSTVNSKVRGGGGGGEELQHSYYQTGPSPIYRPAPQERTPYLATPHDDEAVRRDSGEQRAVIGSSSVTTRTTTAGSSAMNGSVVIRSIGAGGLLPPVPVSPTKGREDGEVRYYSKSPQPHATPYASTTTRMTTSTNARASHLAQIAKDMGADPITQREVQHAENVMTNAEYQASRRRYKKALMQQALS